MLFILSSLSTHRMLDYMSKGYFENDYFEAGDDPSLHFLLQQGPQRKLSYDQLLPNFCLEDDSNPVSHTTCDSPKPKPQEAISSSNPQKKTKKRRENTKTLAQGIKRGHWTTEQNKRYHWFLEVHSHHFINKHMRRMDKIFKTMEKFVTSREAEQCRSHHQKMQKKHGSFAKILKELRIVHYGSGDADLVSLDMKSNGVQFQKQLMSWAQIESGVVEKADFSESEKETVNEIPEISQAIEYFIDPFEQFQCDGDQLLEALIS